MEDLHPPVVMLDQRVAAFHPVAVVPVFDGPAVMLEHPELGGVDVAAHHPVDPALASRAGDDFLVLADELDRVLDLVLGRLGERPVRLAQPAPHRVHDEAELHDLVVGMVADEGEPAVRKHHRVKLVAVQHHQPPPVRGVVEGRAADFDPAEVHSGELAEHLVVVAGDVDHARAAPRALHDAPHDVIVRGRPVELLLQPPPVDDVADQVHGLAVDIVEEVDQQLGVAALGAEVDVADPDRAVGAPRVAFGLGDPRGAEREAGDVVADEFGEVSTRHGKSLACRVALSPPLAGNCYTRLSEP